MVELRKRKEAPPPPPPAKKRAPSKAKKDAPKVEKEAEAAKAPEVAVEDAPPAAVEEAPAATKATGPPKVGESIELNGFGGEVQTHSEEATTLAKLLEASKSGVVLFTYPKASTPGCTTQVCLFRDAYDDLTKAGLSVYGLSNDSPKANKNFVEKQKLQYPLLCDPKQTLISAIGLKKAPKGTTRGVFVVDKTGKVLASEPGGPAATLEVVKKIVAGLGGDADSDGIKQGEDVVAAETAADVADTAEKLDGDGASKL
ncbi:AhpC-TSA-domain-containing protein [Sphaerulina musiva SO2202]|uniref:thioredoxin-dependent peroxiredoxin n=1 Tax=Sphaerulina musiva (strain SO2202) TaxID=692275 RepID=M3CWG5_SPHMS|nr:AhpC-TSA-domain-containing protein [Sphaerulina musiva SO2202]EMF08467.1 AhpC-TSA-domain-containing protein [Sphaerulina musiva SO2202]